MNFTESQHSDRKRKFRNENETNHKNVENPGNREISFVHNLKANSTCSPNHATHPFGHNLKANPDFQSILFKHIECLYTPGKVVRTKTEGAGRVLYVLLGKGPGEQPGVNALVRVQASSPASLN